MDKALIFLLLLGSAWGQILQTVATGKPPVASQVATPTYDNDTGSYVTTVSVTISDATGGAAITYCTAVGSDCSPVGGTSYTVPVVITVDTTHLCSYATHAGMTDSATKCGTYTITGASITRVNGGTKSCSSSPCTSSAVDMSSPAPTLCVVVSTGYNADVTVNSSPANTWNALTTYSQSGLQFSKISYAYNPTVSSSMTFTGTGGGGYPTLFYRCYAGTLATSAVLDATTATGNNTGATTSCQTGSTGTLSQANELVVAGAAAGGANSMTNSVDSSFTDLLTQTSGLTFEGGASATLIPGATTALNPTFTMTGGTVASSCTIAGFKHP